jgi:hypothetical protein
MNFKNEFLAALEGRHDYDALMDLVRRFRTQGLSSDVAYETLQEIWQERGFAETVADEGSLQDTLETVMEKVWYGQPV